MIRYMETAVIDLIARDEKLHKKACNDDRYDYMTQLIQISHLVNFSAGLANQGGVLEGVVRTRADSPGRTGKPFFCTSSSRASCLFATVRLRKTQKVKGHYE